VKASEAEAAQLARATGADAAHDSLLVPATAARRELDLGRDVHALLGLVFDRIDLDRTAAHVRRCIATKRRCFLSTPNVNFAVAAMNDSAFRGSVLRSDLSVADGFPIVRIARAMGIELPGRVAGADLFERLQAAGRSAQQPPIRLYLFGGPPGIGARAVARLNAQAGGFECVGHDEGGFGDVEAMSSLSTIERINASGADFVLVALGAKKGQAWIERNRERLRAPVLCHLGAVINFAADSVARAPAWMQRSGLEWVWRIGQEPQLRRRYWNDGRVLLRELATQALRSARQPAAAGQPARFEIEAAGAHAARIVLAGDWRGSADQTALRRSLAQLLREGVRLEFDLAAAPAVGSALLGLIALIDAWQVAPRALRSATLADPALHAVLRAHGARHLIE
jgi:N-acetylglucosaminyldiphosphoundecaprenol N-acetyl-beta-D-mannosaminyltransferase